MWMTNNVKDEQWLMNKTNNDEENKKMNMMIFFVSFLKNPMNRFGGAYKFCKRL